MRTHSAFETLRLCPASALPNDTRFAWEHGVCIALALIVAVFAPPAHAAWAPTTIANAPGAQYAPQVVSDGAGGAVVAWFDDRSGAGTIYAHHFLASDVPDPAWPVNGLPVGPAGDDPTPAIASDGAGGAIVCWIKGAGLDVFAQRVLASGVLDPSWPAGGVAVCTAPENQIGVRAVSDGAGGAFLTWLDYRNAMATDRDVFAQHVLAGGTVDPTWLANGLGVSTQPGAEGSPVVISDGSGGVIIAWDDIRNANDYDVYAQRLLVTGAIASGWTAGGKALTGNNSDQGAPRVCPDGAGGAIVAWSDSRNGVDYDIYAMRVLASGALGQGWQNGGEAVCEAAGNQEPFEIVADGSGGAVASWYDFRAGDGYSDIYVQRMTASGSMSWTADGVAMCTAVNYQVSPSLGADGTGGAFIAWQDRRHETTNFETELYLHHVLSSGSPDPAWPANGGRVTYDGGMRFGGGYGQPLLTTGAGGAVVSWAGDDLYAMNLNLTWTPFHSVAISISPSGTGSVSKNPDRLSYPNGSNVTLTATSAASYGFTGWSGDATGTTNPLVVTIDAAKNITANFATYSLAVAVSPVGSGAVSKSPNAPSYPPGASVTLTASPAIGYAFGSWSGDATGTSNPLSVTMDASKNITANFVGYPVNVAISPGGAGTVTKNPNQATYAPGSTVTLTANSAFLFQEWSGDASGTTNPLSVLVDGPKSITANFQAYTLVTTVSPGEGGTISKSPNQTLYPPGPVTLTLSVAPGYTFNGWSGDASGTDNPLTLQMDDSKSVTANLSPLPPACGNWSAVVTAASPSGRDGGGSAWDPVRHRMLIFGGGGYSTKFNDVWQLTMGATPAWSQVSTSGTPPSPRRTSMVYDSARDRMLIFGGQSSAGHLNEVWALSLGGSHTWTQISPSGTPPAPRQSADIIYDPVRDQLVVFGGSGTNFFNDTWTLSLAGTPTWTHLPVSPPPFMQNPVAIYDPLRDRMVLFGRQGAWALSLANPIWTNLFPFGTFAGTPEYGFGAAYDPIRDRAILVGAASSATQSFTFRYQPAWVLMNPGGVSSIPRAYPLVAYDPDDDLFLMFGGGTLQDTTRLSDTRRLDFAGGYALDVGTNGAVQLNPNKCCYSPGEHVIVTPIESSGYAFEYWFGDASGTANPLDLTMDAHKAVMGNFHTPTTDVEGQTLEFVVGRIHPNPSSGGVTVEYSLPRQSRVALRVFDVTGREVTRLVEGTQPGGRHAATWDGTARGAHAHSGVYVVQLDTGEGRRSRRFVLLR